MGRPTLLAALLLVCVFAVSARRPPPCNSPIYCHGELLHTIQMAQVYEDSKTFVDMKMKYSENETLMRFEQVMNQTNRHPTKADLFVFLNETFELAGSEFEPWEPTDWVENPKFLDRIQDDEFKIWARKLNNLWTFLGRKMKDDVKDHQDRYSIIYVPHPVIVPGGRFREFYYWDSYWIVRGLLLSEMYATVKGMLGNFLTVVENYGFIPNGGRIYYSMRSQPPLLVPMMKSYLEFTKDEDFVKENLNTLDKEFQYWMVNHTVNVEKDGNTYQLARYNDESSGPRPESYREDFITGKTFKTEEEKDDYYSELKAAAESGWDFSSRWFILNGTNKGNLTNLKIRYIIPVDLNAIIFWNAEILEEFHIKFGSPEKAEYYRKIANNWKVAVTKVLWHDEVGAWLDYDTINEKKRDYFYPTNISPLWTGCYDRDKSDSPKIGKILKYLEKTNIMVYKGGVTTTQEHSGEQWDYPNAWPPLQYIMIMGLDATEDVWAKRLALEITERWVRSNFKAYNETGIMFEKYDVSNPGAKGVGGEYHVQQGFGWTNGIIMELLYKYGDVLQVNEEFAIKQARSAAQIVEQSTTSQVLTALLVLFATLATGSIGLLVYKKWTQSPSVVPGTLNQRRTFMKPGHRGYTELRDMNFD